MLGTMRVPCFDDVLRAAQAIAPYVQRTPLLRSPALDALAGGTVWIKPESLQVTGSFKARGAFNALLALTPQQRERGVVAYSTGNHGQAIAWAARQLGVSATIVMPVDAPKTKVARASRRARRSSTTTARGKPRGHRHAPAGRDRRHAGSAGRPPRGAGRAGHRGTGSAARPAGRCAGNPGPVRSALRRRRPLWPAAAWPSMR